VESRMHKAAGLLERVRAAMATVGAAAPDAAPAIGRALQCMQLAA
jgi:hypothetical protein